MIKLFLIELRLLELVYNPTTAKRIFVFFWLTRILLGIALGVFYVHYRS